MIVVLPFNEAMDYAKMDLSLDPFLTKDRIMGIRKRTWEKEIEGEQCSTEELFGSRKICTTLIGNWAIPTCCTKEVTP